MKSKTKTDKKENQDNINLKDENSHKTEHSIKWHRNGFAAKGNSWGKKKKILRAFFGVLIIVVCILIFIFVPHWGYTTESGSSENDSQTTSAALQSMSTYDTGNEQLKFEKTIYPIQIGKTSATKTIYTPKDDKSTAKPVISYTSDNPDVATVDKDGNIKGVSAGTAGIIAVTATGMRASCVANVSIPSSYQIKDVPFITQNEDFVSGCESVSATMLLQYYGFKIDTEDFVDDYLPQQYLTMKENGELVGPDIETAFIGSPYSEDSMGCFPPVMVKAINDYLNKTGSGNKYKATNVSAASMNGLITEYIANGDPVLIWATMNMWEPVVTYTWTVEGAADYSDYKDGDTCDWLANEHCMVLIGYDEDYYYLNDPLGYSAPTAFEREIFDQRYTEMGKGAVVIQTQAVN